MSPVDLISPARWFRIAVMLSLGMIAIFAEAAPMGIGPTARPSPDLLLCVVAYWAIRRPGSTPLIAVAALGLMRDLLTDVPPGAGMLTLVLAAEVLKAWRRTLARSSFIFEWIAVAGAAFAILAVQWVLVVILLAQPPYIVDLGYQGLYTAAIYPPIVLVFRWLFRISWRKPEPVI